MAASRAHKDQKGQSRAPKKAPADRKTLSGTGQSTSSKKPKRIVCKD
jgi:hypothetical protein